MTTCQSCGGIIGRDCFNPEECMAITRDMADRYQQQHDAAGRLDQCEAALDQCRAEIQFLSDRIERMNAVLGRVRMQCRMSQKLYSEIDEVMTKEERR